MPEQGPPFSQRLPENPGGHKQAPPLQRPPFWHTTPEHALFSQRLPENPGGQMQVPRLQ